MAPGDYVFTIAYRECVLLGKVWEGRRLGNLYFLDTVRRIAFLRWYVLLGKYREIARQTILSKYGETSIIFYFEDTSCMFDGGVDYLPDSAASVRPMRC
jgi:hypothetical protein